MPRLQHPTAGTVVRCEGDLAASLVLAGWADPSAVQVPVLLEKPDEVVTPILEQDESEAVDSVDELDDAAEEVPVDQEEAAEVVELEAPRGNASLEDWAAYAISKGVAGETLNGLKQSEIRALFAEK